MCRSEFWVTLYHQIFEALRSFLRLVARRDEVLGSVADSMFQRLQEEVFTIARIWDRSGRASLQSEPPNRLAKKNIGPTSHPSSHSRYTSLCYVLHCAQFHLCSASCSLRGSDPTLTLQSPGHGRNPARTDSLSKQSGNRCCTRPPSSTRRWATCRGSRRSSGPPTSSIARQARLSVLSAAGNCARSSMRPSEPTTQSSSPRLRPAPAVPCPLMLGTIGARCRSVQGL